MSEANIRSTLAVCAVIGLLGGVLINIGLRGWKS